MPRPPTEETEPDYRFTLANERTFLAWTRTCLALLASAVAVVQFAPDLGSRAFREVAAVVLAALAAITSVGGLWRWYLAQRLMRRGQSLGHSPLPLLLGATLALVALGVLIVLLVELAS